MKTPINIISKFDIVRVDLINPAGKNGHEQAGLRPVIVISLCDNDPDNPMVTVIPFTGKLSKIRFPHTLVIEPSIQNGLSTKSVLLVFQVVSIDKRRIIEKIGTLEETYVVSLHQLIRSMLQI